MILLAVQDISKHFGPEPVLHQVTLEIRRGDRISLIGPNGTGKTTLLRILADREEPDHGSRYQHPSARLGFLEQQPEWTDGRTVWDEALDALSHLVAMAHEAEQLGEAISLTTDSGQRQRLSNRFDQLQHELQQRNGYHLDHKIQRVLTGLGLPESAFQQPVTLLSGGQQNRLMLAKLLLQDADVLLLDEPSNHLDLEATQWLEDFLVATRQTLVVVSHDRYFLDKVTTRTLELVQATVDSYSGNFSAYMRQKTERLEVQRRTYARQQAEIAKMEDFVRRNAYGQKHAQAEDRRKRLERIEPVAAPREINAPAIRFPAAARSGDIVLRAEHISKAFSMRLFQDVSFDILRGEKWAVLGPNGSGKTTLVRCLLGTETLDQGRITRGTGVQIGYFDQHLQCLDGQAPVVDAIRPDHKEFVEGQRRSLLARFGITGDMAFQPVDQLSGGERNRSALAYLAAQDANLLVLDEPTNHLDLWARQALQDALRQFDGTVLLVSHDRYFLNQVDDHMLVIQPDRCLVVEGNYDTYLHLVARTLAESKASEGVDRVAQTPASSKPPQQRRQPRRRRKFPYRKVEDVESDIFQCESRIEQLHQDLASPQLLRDGPRVKRMKEELLQQQQRLKELYEHWEEASELN